MVNLSKNASANWLEGSSRSKIYSFLSVVFKDELTSGYITGSLSEQFWYEQEERARRFCPEKANIYQGFLSDLQEWPNSLKDKPDPEKEDLELRKEFAYLFLSPHGVKPYESIYRGKKNLLMDKPWEKVRNFYRWAGMSKDNNEMHPEDHLSVELGFMAVFSHISGDQAADENGKQSGQPGSDELALALEIQQKFLDLHLVKWVPAFCADMQEKARHQFYKNIAGLTGSFIELDRLIMLKHI